MEKFADIIKNHAVKYPVMQPDDVVKLIYQSVFGGGHLIKDRADITARLMNEYRAVSHEGERRTESLGDCSRIYIDCELSARELELIARIFVASSKKFAKSYDSADEAARDRFSERIGLAAKLVKEGVFGFSSGSFEDYLRKYFTEGCPAVSHSEAYRAAYSPAYRVIDSRYTRLIGCIIEIDRILRLNKTSTFDMPVVIAIDGRAASGKSTAAELIADVFNISAANKAEIVHMDDFFLPFGLRTPERLAEAGGNLHRERFQDEVLSHIRDKNGFSYREFDCSSGDYNKNPRRITSSRLIICEGAYALHPSFGKYYDFAVFSNISREEQERRILDRNGEKMLERFKTSWIPMEEHYFEIYRIINKCAFIV